MKAFIACVILSAGLILAGNEKENLIQNHNFRNGFQSYFRNDKGQMFLAGNDVLQIKGVSGIENAKLSNKLKLKPEALRGKKFLLSFDAKAEKLSGNVMIAIREWEENGKTIAYHAVTFNKWSRHDWKTFKKEFILSAKAVHAGMYLTTSYQNSGDSFLVRNLSLIQE